MPRPPSSHLTYLCHMIRMQDKTCLNEALNSLHTHAISQSNLIFGFLRFSPQLNV